MDENRDNIIVAVVALAAIVGLVSSISGVNLSGLFDAVGAFDVGSAPAAPADRGIGSAYEYFVGYPADSGIDPAAQQDRATGIDLGNACMNNWNVATQGPYEDCCPASCGQVCTDGNCFRECVSGCYSSVRAAFGY